MLFSAALLWCLLLQTLWSISPTEKRSKNLALCPWAYSVREVLFSCLIVGWPFSLAEEGSANFTLMRATTRPSKFPAASRHKHWSEINFGFVAILDRIIVEDQKNVFTIIWASLRPGFTYWPTISRSHVRDSITNELGGWIYETGGRMKFDGLYVTDPWPKRYQGGNGTYLHQAMRKRKHQKHHN